MVKNKKLSQDQIIFSYMEYILENNTPPKSVYAFSKAYNMEEAHFYSYFGSFETIEKTIFKAFFNNTLKALHKSEEYPTFDARNKLLSFYFTFFENLSANRSYVLFALKNSERNLKKLKVLSDLRDSFMKYIGELNIETFDFKKQEITKIQEKAITETAWMQLLITIHFWINDTSAQFEKTDVFIEKAVNTSFDLLNTTPLKNIIDLGKFLYKEKMDLKI